METAYVLRGMNMWGQNVSLDRKVASRKAGMMPFGFGTLQISVIGYVGIGVQMNGRGECNELEKLLIKGLTGARERLNATGTLLILTV